MKKLTLWEYFRENKYTHLIIVSALMLIGGTISVIKGYTENIALMAFGILIGITVYWQGVRVYRRFYNRDYDKK